MKSSNYDEIIGSGWEQIIGVMINVLLIRNIYKHNVYHWKK